MDTVDRQTRSKIMASVGQKDTGAELLLRSALHKVGLRYRLHDRALPGSPDLVFLASMPWCSFTAATGIHMDAIGPPFQKADTNSGPKNSTRTGHATNGM
jgi:DNA mismatch endonuclease Vsr